MRFAHRAILCRFRVVLYFVVGDGVSDVVGMKQKKYSFNF